MFDLAFDFQMKYWVDIRVIVKNQEHFEHWLGALPFYDNVQREGVVLYGEQEGGAELIPVGGNYSKGGKKDGIETGYI